MEVQLKTTCLGLFCAFYVASLMPAFAEVTEQQELSMEEIMEEQKAALAEFARRWATDPRPFMSSIPKMKAFVKKLDEFADNGSLTPDQESYRQTLKKLVAQAPPLLPDEYNIFCESEENVGLNWENGKWKRAFFGNNKRLVVKSEDNQCRTTAKFDDFARNEETGKISWYTRYVCLNEREFGAPFLGHISYYCRESYVKKDDNSGWSVEILCDKPMMALKPDGWYHYTHIHSRLDDHPKNDYKDSMWVEAGKCAMIKP